MDVKKAIEARRSVREYKKKEVPADLIRELVNSARLAPSGHNAQPSRYLIITDESRRKKLKENNIFKQDFVYGAPAIIVCCADPTVYGSTEEDPMNSPNQRRALRDLSIASAFLVLRATELGLGTCYIGWVEKEKIKDVLGIPKEFIVPYVITVGYPSENPESHNKKSVDEVLLN